MAKRIAMCSAAFIKQRRIVLFRGILRSQTFQQLLQVELGVGIDLGQFVLQRFCLGAGVGADFSEFSKQTDGLNDFFFLKRHNAARPGSRRQHDCRRLHQRCPHWCRHSEHCQSGRCRTAPPEREPSAAAISCSKFLRIIQPLLEFGPQRLGCNLRRNGHVGRARIGRHKLHFVDPDRGRLAVSEDVS